MHSGTHHRLFDPSFLGGQGLSFFRSEMAAPVSPSRAHEAEFEGESLPSIIERLQREIAALKKEIETRWEAGDTTSSATLSASIAQKTAEMRSLSDMQQVEERNRLNLRTRLEEMLKAANQRQQQVHFLLQVLLQRVTNEGISLTNVQAAQREIEILQHQLEQDLFSVDALPPRQGSVRLYSADTRAMRSAVTQLIKGLESRLERAADFLKSFQEQTNQFLHDITQPPPQPPQSGNL
jgi:hypothetical protein